jgi:hypothetical protein
MFHYSFPIPHCSVGAHASPFGQVGRRILFLIATERMISSTSLVLVMGLLLSIYVQVHMLMQRQKLGSLALV